jgi:predicted RNase H-like nuclease
MHFFGVDLAWSPRNRVGGVILSADGRLLEATAALGSDDEMLRFPT